MRSGQPRRLPRQTPYRRTYPSGRVAWVARYYDLEGRPRHAKPDWNEGRSAFRLRRDAQEAIDDALAEIHGAPPGVRIWREG